MAERCAYARHSSAYVRAHFFFFFCSRCVFLRKALQLFPRFKSKAACSWKYGTSGIRAVQILRLAIELKGETRHETKRVEVAAPCSRELLNVRRRTGELARGTRRKKYSRKVGARILIRNTSERRIFTLSRVAPNPCRGARKRKPCVCTALYIPRFIAFFFLCTGGVLREMSCLNKPCPLPFVDGERPSEGPPSLCVGFRPDFSVGNFLRRGDVT